MSRYTVQSFIAIVNVENISEHIFDMDEYMNDLEFDFERSLNAQDFFPCVHFSRLSPHDWDEEEEVLIASDDIVILVVLQWEDETLPDDKSIEPAAMAIKAFEAQIEEDGVRGYFDRLLFYPVYYSHRDLERIKDGWKGEE